MGNHNYDHTKQLTLKQRNQHLQQQRSLILSQIQNLQIDKQRQEKIASLTVVQCIELMNQHKLTSEQLLTILAHRTITIAQKLNLFTYLYYDKALDIARKCDQHRRTTNKINITLKQMANINNSKDYQNFLSPLFGVPISIKDVYHLEGRLATIGLLSNANKKHQQSVLIKCFRNAGMIPFVQTNVPQFGMAMETGNFLWGRSKNPWNPQRAVGGSSGGQGGMISSRCSMLGVGSDIGGSIRIPSDHCGVFGLKPNSKRISNTYHASLSKAFEIYVQNIPNCIGPLGRSAEDLALFMSLVTQKQYYQSQSDPYSKIIQFDAKKYIDTKQSSNKYKIGYFDTLQDIQPSQSSQRAVKEVIQILQKNGHQIVKIKIPNQRQIIRSFICEYMSTGGKNYKEMLAGEKAVKQYRSIFLMGQLRAPGRFILSNISKWLMPRTYFYFLQKRPFKDVFEYQVHTGQIVQMRSKWIKYWKQLKLDFVISPGFGCQALPHQKSERLGLASAYTSIWNVLDMAVGAMPVTIVQQNQQNYQSKFKDILTNDLKKVCSNSYGLPVGVQIVGLPYQEEKVLGLMSFLEGKIKFYETNGFAKIDN